MAYVTWGDPAAPPVLCVHGLTRTGRDFDVLARALADRFHVICPDLPGRGASDWLPDPALYQPASYVAALAHLLAVIGRPVAWIGTSLGGICGMAGGRVVRAHADADGAERYRAVHPRCRAAPHPRLFAGCGGGQTFPDLAAIEQHLRRSMPRSGRCPTRNGAPRPHLGRPVPDGGHACTTIRPSPPRCGRPSRRTSICGRYGTESSPGAGGPRRGLRPAASGDIGADAQAVPRHSWFRHRSCTGIDGPGADRRHPRVPGGGVTMRAPPRRCTCRSNPVRSAWRWACWPASRPNGSSWTNTTSRKWRCGATCWNGTKRYLPRFQVRKPRGGKPGTCWPRTWPRSGRTGSSPGRADLHQPSDRGALEPGRSRPGPAGSSGTAGAGGSVPGGAAPRRSRADRRRGLLPQPLASAGQDRPSADRSARTGAVLWREAGPPGRSVHGGGETGPHLGPAELVGGG